MIGLGLIFLSNNQSLRQSRLAESDLVFESWGPALLGRVWLFRILITLVLVTRVPATDFVKMTPDKHSLFLSFFLSHRFRYFLLFFVWLPKSSLRKEKRTE